jgi:hypothetical protein
MGDEGQIHTMEGVIAGLILILTLMYITSSITLVSPQTEKALVMKQGIKAADILNSLVAENITSYHNPLSDAIALWNGNSALTADMDPAYPDNYPVYGTELSIMELNKTIGKMVHDGEGTSNDKHNNTMYNVYLIYKDAAGTYTQKGIILNGEPYDNAASASKFITLNAGDTKSNYWKGYETLTPIGLPKVIEVRLVLWSI